MGFRKSLIFFILMLLISNFSYAGDKPNIVGIYVEVPGYEFAFDGKTVEIVEFLSFYCGHCFNFEKEIPVIKGNFPKKIKWKTIPVYWGKGSPKPGEAYLIAKEAGKGEQMKKAIFEAIFIDRRDIGKIEVLEDIGSKVGLGFEFSKKLRAGDKANDAEEALKLMKKYRIHETPSLIVAGNLMINPGMLNNSVDLMRDNTIAVLKSLFK
jgi:thiol:disulfide interchange protein DsbA